MTGFYIFLISVVILWEWTLHLPSYDWTSYHAETDSFLHAYNLSWDSRIHHCVIIHSSIRSCHLENVVASYCDIRYVYWWGDVP